MITVEVVLVESLKAVALTFVVAINNQNKHVPICKLRSVFIMTEMTSISI